MQYKLFSLLRQLERFFQFSIVEVVIQSKRNNAFTSTLYNKLFTILETEVVFQLKPEKNVPQYIDRFNV